MRHHGTSREKQTNTVVCVGLFGAKTAPNLPVIDRTSSFGAHGCLEEITPVCHSNLKTYRTDYRERCRKTIALRIDPVG